MTRQYEELGVTQKVMTDIIRPDWARKTIYVYHKLQICLSATRINHLGLISRRVAFWCWLLLGIIIEKLITKLFDDKSKNWEVMKVNPG